MLYLYTRPDGSKASADELKRRSGIVPNEGLIMELGSDYNSEKWDMLLSQLDTSEIEDLVAAAGFGTMAMSSIGKPKFNDLDGPSGFNLKMASLLDASSLAFTGFPSNSVLACTWNKRRLVCAYRQPSTHAVQHAQLRSLQRRRGSQRIYGRVAHKGCER